MYSSIYVTTSDISESKKIARVLVQERLAACVNIVPAIESIYRWNGEIEEDSESLIFIKTRSDMVETVIKKVEEIHSYDTPCVLELSIEKGSKKYFKWLDKEVDQSDLNEL
ncbi:MAG: divalent-cation tolerance protein CutA [Methanobacterium sp. ERen5]|nr:MAG: divalent-cation tolerance protein CutA [Methanobacterium sp. ERen5]